MKLKDRVAIVVPCLGGNLKLEETAKKCIERILETTRNVDCELEIIVVVDEYTDEFLEWLREKGVFIHPSKDRRGFVLAYNHGINFAMKHGADYVAIVNSDVLVPEGWLKALLNALKKNPHFGWVACKMKTNGNYTTFGTLGCCLISREAIEKVGLLDLDFNDGQGFDDDDWIRRFWINGFMPHGVTTLPAIHVHPSLTFDKIYGEKRFERFRRNQQIFQQKWGETGTDWSKIPVWSPTKLKLAIIGWDGADFDVVKMLPLEMKEYGILHYIDTYDNSATSWTSFTTGVPPKVHGVLDFKRPFDSRIVKHPRIWHVIEGRWGVINVPFTWPPQKLNGFMVTGLESPTKGIYTYPSGLTKILNEMGYKIHIQIRKDDEYCAMWDCTKPLNIRREVFDREWKDIVAKRVKAVKLLTKIYQIDYLFVVFSVLDAVQHWFYDDREFVAKWYLYLDRITVKLLADLQPRNFIILSDHGFKRSDLGGYRGDHRSGGIWITDLPIRPKNLEDAFHELVKFYRGGLV
ncbi:hypothetical protein DRO29_06165 [Candidatus Bathyarchaeota archaeon]|nr:MAG: hypothetical protein DRO29_06165 [Candidatus Bathyarchaeota archaeon]